MARETKATATAYLRRARQDIEAWEKAPRGYFARFGDFVFSPAAKWTARMIPKSIQSAATFAIEKTLLLGARAGGFGIDQKALARERAIRLGRKRALVPRLRACDGLARKFWRDHCGYAAAQGAATGVAGLAGVVADLPLLVSTAIHAIRSIGLSYGYPATTPEERNYILHVLRAGSSGEPAVRAESLAILKQLENALRPNATVGGKPAPRVRYLMTVEQYAKSLAIDLLRRNVLQLVPLSSIVTGASFNAAYLNDIGRAAYLCYRRRFIEDTLAAEEQSQLARPKRKKPTAAHRKS